MAAPPEKLFSGLDLGKAADFSVLATVGRRKLDRPVAKRRFSYAVRWLASWELGTRYTATRPGERSVIGDVKALFEQPALTWTTLAADYTGVGMAVIEQVQAAKVQARLHPVCITAGHSISTPEETKDGSWHVPKKELVSTLVVLLENDLLKWQAPNTKGALPLIGRFEKELQAFREHVTRSKNVTYGAEHSQHDDIVMGVALACWLAEHTGAGDAAGVSVPEGRDASAVGGAPAGVFASGNGV
ncbi:MAG TPA: hypothetical protein VGE74_28810 [Gemmata sp.]